MSYGYGKCPTPVVLEPLEVVVDRDTRLEKAIKKLKRKMASEGVLKEIRRRRSYIKPSAQRRKKRLDALRRRRRKEWSVLKDQKGQGGARR